MPNDIQKDEYSRLLAVHRAQIYGYILALMMRHEDADDVFQQAAVVMWQKFGEFDPATNFLSWACRISYFEAKNFARKNSPNTPANLTELLDAFAVDDYVGLELSDREFALRECLAKVGEQDRKLLDRVYRDGCTVQAVADSIGRTRKSVSNSLSRVRQALLLCIQRSSAAEGNA